MRASGRADAVARSVAEAEVGYGRAGYIEPFRINECGAVVVGCAVVQQHQITGPDPDVGYPQAGPA
jgi:hypothetical protein